jgi:hypothetical protein
MQQLTEKSHIIYHPFTEEIASLLDPSATDHLFMSGDIPCIPLYSGIFDSEKLDGDKILYNLISTDRRINGNVVHRWWHGSSLSRDMIEVPANLLEGKLGVEEFLKSLSPDFTHDFDAKAVGLDRNHPFYTVLGGIQPYTLLEQMKLILDNYEPK